MNNIKFLFIGIICSFWGVKGTAQSTAVTEEGDTIYIYPNGTWSYELDGASDPLGLHYLDEKLDIDTISIIQVFGQEANKEVETQIKQFKFKYDDKLWKRVPPAEFNDDAEFAFEHRKKDIWSVIITEETEIGKENILKIAKQTMEDNIGSPVILKKVEHRTVNGFGVLRGVFDMNMSGIEFTFDTYYYSDERGTTQITSWTGQKVWEKNEDSIVDFLNGLTIIE